jgi:hypothetical protein
LHTEYYPKQNIVIQRRLHCKAVIES